MRQRNIRTSDFDPFSFNLLFRGLKHSHTAWLTLIGIVIAVAMIVVCRIEGTVGGSQDFQLVEDVRRLLGDPSVPPAEPNFPLIRDVASWYLASTIMIGSWLLHRQWQHMSRCLSTLAENGALIARVVPKRNVLSRIMGVNRMTAGVPPEKALDAVVSRVLGPLSRNTGRISGTLILLAVITALMLTLGQEHGLFQAFAPPDLTPDQRADWLDSAYRSWWASTSHPVGHILYTILAIFAILIVVEFNFVGLIALYLAIAMYFVTQLDADWLNRDGRYGWLPIAKVFRTVFWALAVLGANLSVILVILGIQNFPWIILLIISYIFVLPMFTLAPWLIFRHVEASAKATRIANLKSLVDKVDTDNDISQLSAIVAEIDRCRQAKIRPMRLRTTTFSSLLIPILLPIVLTAAQIWFSVKFGAK